MARGGLRIGTVRMQTPREFADDLGQSLPHLCLEVFGTIVFVGGVLLAFFFDPPGGAAGLPDPPARGAAAPRDLCYPKLPPFPRFRLSPDHWSKRGSKAYRLEVVFALLGSQ